MYTIRKTFHFSASHRLTQVGEQHVCSRLHGHNYEVTLELQAQELDEKGFVKDYRELSAFKNYLDNELDHRHLNDVLGDDCVTAEQIAKHLYDWSVQHWKEVSAVIVCETPRTFAEYRAS